MSLTFCTIDPCLDYTTQPISYLTTNPLMTETPKDTFTEVPTYNAFFYGTLLHPKVLRRVIQNTGSHLKISPAILEGYVRHQVSWADFPAIISSKASREAFDTGSDSKIDCVRGSFVSGLTVENMWRLDRFESGLYTRQSVEVHLLAEPVHLADIDLNALIAPTPEEREHEKMTQALTYIWDKPLTQLMADPWSFEQFIETKLGDWA